MIVKLLKTTMSIMLSSVKSVILNIVIFSLEEFFWNKNV